MNWGLSKGLFTPDRGCISELLHSVQENGVVGIRVRRWRWFRAASFESRRLRLIVWSHVWCSTSFETAVISTKSPNHYEFSVISNTYTYTAKTACFLSSKCYNKMFYTVKNNAFREMYTKVTLEIYYFNIYLKQ